MQVKFNAVVAAAALLIAGAASAQDMVVKIGHVGPTSGGIAHLGKDNEMGARMAIDELNAKGVSIGGKKVKFDCWPKTTLAIRSKARPLPRSWSTPRSWASSAT